MTNAPFWLSVGVIRCCPLRSDFFNMFGMRSSNGAATVQFLNQETKTKKLWERNVPLYSASDWVVVIAFVGWVGEVYIWGVRLVQGRAKYQVKPNKSQSRVGHVFNHNQERVINLSCHTQKLQTNILVGTLDMNVITVITTHVVCWITLNTSFITPVFWHWIYNANTKWMGDKDLTQIGLVCTFF